MLAIPVSSRPITIKIDVPAGDTWRVCEVMLSPWEGSDLATVVFRRPHPRNKTGTAEFAWGSYDFERNRLRVGVDIGMALEDLAPLVCAAICDVVQRDPDCKKLAALIRRYPQDCREEFLRAILTSEVANEDEPS